MEELEDEYSHNYEEAEKTEENYEQVSFVCEDCDYRWENTYANEKWGTWDEKDVVCSMCGSINVTQL